MPPPRETRTIRENIEAVRRMEDAFAERRTASERAADAIARSIGSLKFVALHAAFFAAWIAWNSLPGLPAFDRFPFLLLSLIISMEAIFLATFVLIKQNRMARGMDLRAGSIFRSTCWRSGR